MQQHTMEQATIVHVSTKTDPDGIQMNAMKLIMIPSIDTKYDNFHPDENRNNADL